MTAELAFLVATALYAGFQWCVQLVVYPQFAAVAPADFAAYEAAHQRRITPLVGVLFVGLAGAGGWLLLGAAPATPGWLIAVALALVAAVPVLTGVGAVPQHRVLSTGWDPAAAHRLRRVDRWRTAGATGALVLAVVMVAVAT
ncbi:DUF1772 domain-containing protein [Nakamurella flava]|uniref:DUF1772 domain-containing protein n=1 Tax=Nakamurella flava TaxID=2576308 RepID=A0A4U6QK02_9ACTN|nr:DUF1772 domain-containing protein [Nakamurella flava]TKV60569.1 DUF1772 domain-containing protein [Nakamurella flava]